MKHVISVLVENKFGVLARIAGLFSARGFNIDSLAVGETEDHTVSRMTIVVKGDDRTLEQVKKQLNKLIDIVSVKDFAKKKFVDRELMLFKIAVNEKNKDAVKKVIKKFNGQIIKTTALFLIVQVAGDEEQVKELLSHLAKYKITNMTRTGRIALSLD